MTDYMEDTESENRKLRAERDAALLENEVLRATIHALMGGVRALNDAVARANFPTSLG